MSIAPAPRWKEWRLAWPPRARGGGAWRADAGGVGLPGFDVANWFGIVAPPGTPAAIADPFHAAIADALRDPGVRKQVGGQALKVENLSRARFGDQMKA